MKNINILTLLFTIILLYTTKQGFSQVISAGRNISFDANWSFKKDKNIDAKSANFNDADWRKLDVPHDWSIEDLPNNPNDTIIGPFSKKAIGKNATAFTEGGTAWYRKHFTLDKKSKGKAVFIQFDGVYMNSDVWINGHHLGNHPNGYTSFIYDLTAFLNPIGKPNVIAVQVKNEGDNSRWYSGSGIYRHVWLSVVNPTHIENWGVQITTPNVSTELATVSISTFLKKEAKNTSSYVLTTEIYSNAGQLISSQNSNVAWEYNVEQNPETGQLIASDSYRMTKQNITIKKPDLWDIETPNLYKAKLILKQKSKIIDEYTQTFGIRSIKFDAETGFTLNGKNVKLKGGCVHHDNGALGAAAIDRAEERKIELLKKNGYNAVRFAHNPYSPQLLDACDKLGILVMNEAFDMWNKHKTPDDYAQYFKEWGEKDLTSIILRDFNHPSVIMMSIGNEIPEIIDTLGYETSAKLANLVHRLDASRPVTNAIPFHIPLINRKKWDITAPSFASLDVGGYNYAMQYYESDHKKYPQRIMVATEYFPPKALENWNYVEKYPYVIGVFSWAAMDYLGEAGIGLARIKDDKIEKKTGIVGSSFVEDFMSPQWTIFNSYTGELDLIGNKKAASYYLDVVWRRSPIEILVHRPIPKGKKEIRGFYDFPDELKSWTWNGHENDSLQVHVYTRSPKVKLELNGKIIAEQKITEGAITATFKVPYTAGKLVARCYEGEKEIASETLTTAGKPTAIRLKSDKNSLKANKNDLAHIQVEIIDEVGNVVPNVDDALIKYQISGNGNIIGVGNGNPRDMSSFQKLEKKVFQGRGLVIVQPTEKVGDITIKAQAEELKEAVLTIKIN